MKDMAEKIRITRRPAGRPRWAWCLVVLPLLFVGTSVPAFAQEQGEEEEYYALEAPDAAESGETIPPGHIEVQLMFDYGEDWNEEDQAKSSWFSGSELLVRFGIVDRLEARFRADGYLYDKYHPRGDHTEQIRGFGDVALGAKYHLLEEEGWVPCVGVIVEVSFPVGKDKLSSRGFDPSVSFSFDHELVGELYFGTELGYARQTVDEGRRGINVFEYAASLYYDATDFFGVFFQGYGELPLSGNEGPAHSIGGGFQFTLSDRFAVDLSGAIGISEAAGDWDISLGMTFGF